MRENEKAYSQYISGKSVAIVGPAASLIGENNGEKIDSHDIIVRINNDFPLSSKLSKDIGSRTDVLYHVSGPAKRAKEIACQTGCDAVELLDGIQWCVTRAAIAKKKEKIKRFMKSNSVIFRLKHENKIKVIEISRFGAEIQKELSNTQPYTGVLAVCHLLNFKLKLLSVYGFDFYRSGYHPDYFLPSTVKWDDIKKIMIRTDGTILKTPKIPHDNIIQIKYLIELAKQDERLKIYSDLKTILKETISPYPYLSE